MCNIYLSAFVTIVCCCVCIHLYAILRKQLSNALDVTRQVHLGFTVASIKLHHERNVNQIRELPVSNDRQNLTANEYHRSNIFSTTIIAPRRTEVFHRSLLKTQKANEEMDYVKTLKHVNYGCPSFINPKLLNEPSYFHPVLGYFYNMSIPEKNTYYKRIIYTSRLRDDFEQTNYTVEGAFNDWQSRFKRLKDEVYAEFIKYNKPNRDFSKDEQYSTVIIWRRNSTNSFSMIAHNVCIEAWIHEKGYTYCLPCYGNHIYHSVEGMGQVLSKLFSPASFPYMYSVMNTQLLNSDNDWITNFHRILLDSIPLPSSKKLLRLNDVTKLMKKGSTICFDQLVALDRSRENGDGGFFTGFLAADWIRSIFYKHYKVNVKPRQRDYYNLLFLERTNNRFWANKENILNHIVNHFREKLRINDLILSAASLQSQIKTWYDSDIVIGSHGAAFTNCVFMLPHTVLIEVAPAHFAEFLLEGMILHTRVHYIYVPSYDNAYVVSKGKSDPTEWYNKGEYFYHRYDYKFLDLVPKPLMIISAIDDALEYIIFMRNHYLVNDFLSPIFYFLIL